MFGFNRLVWAYGKYRWHLWLDINKRQERQGRCIVQPKEYCWTQFARRNSIYNCANKRTQCVTNISVQSMWRTISNHHAIWNVTRVSTIRFRFNNTPDTPIFLPLDISYCILSFSSIALYMRIALKSQYLYVVGAKPSNENVKYKCYHCAFQIFHIFAGRAYKMYNGQKMHIKIKMEDTHFIRHRRTPWYTYSTSTWHSTHHGK